MEVPQFPKLPLPKLLPFLLLPMLIPSLIGVMVDAKNATINQLGLSTHTDFKQVKYRFLAFMVC